jgi:signal transduction histidine kinase/ligand-binding sensor domain-containing protein/DNA-binding NarL/FixJ family response regulator
MRIFVRILVHIILILFPITGTGQNIFRFEHMGSEDGLSQNTGFSILFDSKGFMWIGTMNGLNRYDGYEFKIFKSRSQNTNSFTNNRVTKLWEDRKGFIWLETYDGYYHFFNPETEIFSSLPFYEGTIVKNGAMHCFLQYSDDIILLGSSNSGVFYLKYDSLKATYNVRQYFNPENAVMPDKNVSFIHSDVEKNIWIGTRSGLAKIRQADIGKTDLTFIRQFEGTAFTAVCETINEIWFGTDGKGITVYDKNSQLCRSVSTISSPEIRSDRISFLYRTRTGSIITGFEGEGVMIYDSTGMWMPVKFHGKTITGIYEDRFSQLWLTATEFGVTRLNLKDQQSEYYVLTPDEIKTLTDLERPQFFEDSKDNLWVGLHGSGLALYNRKDDHFEFFRNNPKDPNSISSNIVHCIAEDKTGQLWLGTGQVLGGIEKVILRNPAFEHYLLEKEKVDVLDNVARAIIEDKNKYLWVGTKAGKLHLFDSTLKQVHDFISLPGIGNSSLRNNTYSMYEDSDGYLWIGTKGYGLSVTTEPLSKFAANYNNIKFKRYEFSDIDNSTIGNNNIYSICQDKQDNIWIGSYGNGLSLIKNPREKDLKFIRINQMNSNLSSNLIRHLLIDTAGNLWVATTFGLNFLERANIEKGKFQFKTYLRDPSNDKSLSYNDIIHIFQDSKGRLWFGTFGGGVDLFEQSDSLNATFKHYNSESVPGYGIIFGILEDNRGYIWLSSENGLTCLNPENANAEIFNSFNGLGFNSFSENTCCMRRDGSLVFGGYLGFEVIRPENLSVTQAETHIELTKFLLFNKEISIDQKSSPLKKSISFSDQIHLKYFQSSFSIDFSALDFLDPEKIQYAYKLDNFEDNWNYVGNQHRATYTNLSPGKYTFRVKTIQSGRKLTAWERVLIVRIFPPWWKTLPAYFIYTLLIILIITLIYNAINRINRYKNELAIEKKINELKLQFFTNISHEIRTPLTLIIGPLEDILNEDEISPLKRVRMEIMLKNAKRMLHLTNQLLDFRKVQNNKMVLRIREIDIVSFTREIFDSFGPLVKHKGINCSFDSQYESFKIFADPNKLDIIIYNIISNATKFTNSGKHVSVKIKDSENNNCVDISVTDEGPGILQKNLSEIFTRYTILSNEELAGTGIGLSLSYELARLHGGDILISSEIGKGSTFTIRLLKGKDYFLKSTNVETYKSDDPDSGFIHAGDNYSNIEENDELPDSYSPDKNTIIVVEDNHEILSYICQSLKSSYICIGAKNGNEGLHLAKSMNPDIIITDIKMPGMDGMEMTKLLKEDFITSHIPVIMLTSKSDMKDQIAGIENGAEAYIVKPFNMEYLKSVAANLINQRANVIARFINKKIKTPDLPKVNSKDEEFLTKLVTYIEDNYSKDFAIDALAEQCNLSRTVFYNKLKGLTGSKPIEFVRQIKLNIAARLLEKGYNVSEAAYKTGFSDVKYFSRLFKIQFGYLPSKHKSED